MVNDFEKRVIEARDNYRREKYMNPKYLIINENTFSTIKNKVVRRKMFLILDKKIYMELYIAIDNELEDYEFVITG